jgi:hypothetical protein
LHWTHQSPEGQCIEDAKPPIVLGDTVMSEAAVLVRAPTQKPWNFGPIFDAFKDRAPVIEHGEDADFVVFEGNRRPVLMVNNQAGRDAKDFKMLKGRQSDKRNTYDPVKRLADMDLDGIDAAILFGGGPLGTFDNDLYIASYDAYNRWVMDWASNAPKRLLRMV